MTPRATPETFWTTVAVIGAVLIIAATLGLAAYLDVRGY
jgi:hypothetical protein